MYNLEQLNQKELAELQKIAEELGIQNADRMDKGALMFLIIDEQAEAAAANSTDKPVGRKRARVSLKSVDRVYSANQTKTKKIDKKMTVAVDDSLFGAFSEEEKKMLTPVVADVEEKETTAPDVQPSTEPAPQPEVKETKKRGSKKNEATAETAVAETAEAAPKKRGRKKAEEVQETAGEGIKLEVTIDEPAKEEPAQETEPAAAVAETGFVPPVDGTDFIIVKDIPDLSGEYIVNHNPESASRNGADNGGDAARNRKGNEKVQEKPVEKKEKPADKPAFDNIIKVSGVLEVIDNYGFLRSSDYNYLPSPDDVYVTLQQIKRWGLKMGDVVECYVRPPRDGERFFPMTEVISINGCDPQQVRNRVGFEFLTPLFPDEKFRLCTGAGDSKSSRIVDLFSPIGKGQRALIVAQPKTGKTLLMKDIANSIARNHPEAYLMMLLIDERPEEVTDMARTVNAEVIASTFDAPAENHVKIAGIVLEKAKRMVECGHDVVIFLDSITRLARAYNTVSPASGKVLSGGVDANALHKPKRFFGAARNIEGGGSLTIIATALIDTGSKMDEVIFEEFKGTGNMELQLDRQLANKRVFPAVNLIASSTRRDDLLQDQTTLNRMWVLRKHIADMTSLEAMDTVMNYIEKTKSNEEFLLSMNG